MSDMKCPFCKEEVISDLCFLYDKKTRDYINGTQIYKCNKCGLFGNKELWQELIRTRKALDVGVDVLKEIDELLSSNKFDVKEVPLLTITQTKISMLLKCINIEQITALKQKDVK